MSWNFEQDFMGWGNQADEEELSEEELAQELEAYLQALESGGLPNIGRDMQEGSWREGSPPPSSIRRLNRKNGEVGAIQELASRETPSIGRAMQEGSWQGSPAPQQPVASAAPQVNGWANWTAGSAVDAAPQVNAPGAWPDQQPPAPTEEYDERDYYGPRVAGGPDQVRAGTTTAASATNARVSPADMYRPITELSPEEIERRTQAAFERLANRPRSESTRSESIPPPNLEGAYANTIYAGMSPEDRALMQLQPSETRNSLRRTFEGFGVPVEFQGVSDGSTMPVVPAAMMNRMGLANAAETPYMRGAVFDDEMVNGVPTFTNESIRRREQLGWLPKAADEQARIERNAQEDFERQPDVRAAREQARLEQESKKAELTTEYDLKRRNELDVLTAAAEAEETIRRRRAAEEGRSRNAWRRYVKFNENGEIAETDLASLLADPQAAETLSQTVSGQLAQRFNAAGLIGEGPGQFKDEEAITNYTARLLERSHRDQLDGHLPINIDPQSISDIILLATSAGARTKGGFLGMQSRPGGYVPDSLGQALNVIADLVMESGNSRSSGPNTFSMKNLTGEEANAWGRIRSVVDTAAQSSPGNPQYRRYIDGRISQLESELRDTERKLSPAPYRTHMRGNPVEYPRTVPPQERAQLEAELATLRRDLTKFTEAAARSIRANRG